MNEEQLLSNLKELRESKDVDLIAEAIREIIAMYGLTMAEVAAVNYYIMEQAVKSPVNSAFIKDHLGIDVESLGLAGVLQIQRALVAAYVESIKE